ncbi:MAG: Gfo/Idh/MocA family oxidoreductase [candidate division Zixibacteria bacterium]|nr:Gfo/Idh/MocA family oxidoreductase [candidate division Zixibacteria bacterium]
MPRFSRPIGVAIIGTRFGNLHAEAISEMPDRARVVAICSATEEHARQSAAKWGAEIGTTSFDEALCHPGVDTVHICTPHHLHAPMALAAARAGKHILTEKPIAATLEDADRMIEAAQAADVRLMVSLNQRFLLHHQRAKLLVESGVCGDIFLCHATFLGFSPIKGWRFDAAQVGGGALIDSGMHRIDLLRWIAGDVVRVQAASGRYVHQAMQGEDTALVLLHFASGAVGHIACSWGVRTPVREEALMLAGTQGTIWTDNRDMSVRHTNDQTIEQETFPEVSYPDSVKNLIRHFVDCVQTGTPPRVTAEDGREALRIAQAAYTSIRIGNPVTLERSSA